MQKMRSKTKSRIKSSPKKNNNLDCSQMNNEEKQDMH